MSDYEGITGELRDAAKRTTAPIGTKYAVIDPSEFGNLCDHIDAIHEQLERENEALKEQVGLMRPKDAEGETWYIGDKAYSHMFPEFSPNTVCGFGVISDRPVLFYLGKFGYGNTPELHGGWDYADSVHHLPLERLESIVHDETQDEAPKGSDGWFELPKDADGETWHIGDEAISKAYPKFGHKTVCGMGVISERPVLFYLSNSGYGHSSDPHDGWDYADIMRHYRPDTWERIIEDALSAKWSSRGERSADFDALVARCKALCERTKEEA